MTDVFMLFGKDKFTGVSQPLVTPNLIPTFTQIIYCFSYVMRNAPLRCQIYQNKIQLCIIPNCKTPFFNIFRYLSRKNTKPNHNIPLGNVRVRVSSSIILFSSNDCLFWDSCCCCITARRKVLTSSSTWRRPSSSSSLSARIAPSSVSSSANLANDSPSSSANRSWASSDTQEKSL